MSAIKKLFIHKNTKNAAGEFKTVRYGEMSVIRSFTVIAITSKGHITTFNHF